MSASDQIRMMLDQLMGTAREGEQSTTKVKFEDAEVCKSFLLGCCPHDLLSSTVDSGAWCIPKCMLQDVFSCMIRLLISNQFITTILNGASFTLSTPHYITWVTLLHHLQRMDLGECRLIHDIALRSDFEKASNHRDYYYDIDALEHLERFLGDCDTRVDQSKRKLKDNQEELSGEAADLANKIHDIGEQIGTQLVQAEQLGAEGKVDESLELMSKVDELKKQKLQVELEYRNILPMSSYQQQTLRVCEVCGAFLGIYDNDRRLADHFGGKLHVGFIVLRKRFQELKDASEERKRLRQNERERDREIISARRERERGGDEKGRERGGEERGRERVGDERGRERSRGEKSRERSRERSRHSSHKRSGSRDRKKKHKHSSHSHRSRSKDGSRRRSRDHY